MITIDDLVGFDSPVTLQVPGGSVSAVTVRGRRIEWRNGCMAMAVDDAVARRYFAALKLEAASDLGLAPSLDPLVRVTPVGFFKDRIQ